MNPHFGRVITYTISTVRVKSLSRAGADLSAVPFLSFALISTPGTALRTPALLRGKNPLDAGGGPTPQPVVVDHVTTLYIVVMGGPGAGHFRDEPGVCDGLLAGGDERLPARASGFEGLAKLSYETAVKQQRMAKRMLAQMEHRQIFGAKADPQRDDDPVLMQVLSRMSQEYERLLAIHCETPDQELKRAAQRIAVLTGIGTSYQAGLSEISKVTLGTTKAAIEAKKLILLAERMKKNDEDEITDAELEA